MLAALCLASPALAQTSDAATLDDDKASERIVVTATGGPSAIERSGQAISVILEVEIDSIQGPDLSRVLERAAGVTITRNGGVGGFTGVRVRGAEAEQLLVLVDGVRVGDVAAPGGGFDFGNLLAGSIARVELLRGSNSVVWGSQAIGGVLVIETRGEASPVLAVEYGANDTVYATASGGLAGEGYRAGLALSFHDGDGISSFAGGDERDGFRQYQASGQARIDLARGFDLAFNARYADGRTQIDGFPAPLFAFADTAERQDTRELGGRAALNWRTNGLDLTAAFARSGTDRDLVDPAFGDDPYFTTRGRGERGELIGRWSPLGGVTVDFGADREWTRFATGPSFGSEGEARINSAHALVTWARQALTLAAGARIDDHSRFGGEVTLGANGSFALSDRWRVRASYGEGFKAPTLFQLLSDFGNPALSPERSRGYDIGIERGDRNAPLHFALTAFRRDSRDLIDFVSCFGVTGGICAGRPFGTYDNINRARAEGFEAELGAQLGEAFRASAAYSFVKARNRETSADLARRPRHALTLAADWTTPLAGLTLGADLRTVSDSFDDAGNFVPIDGHALATLRAALPLGERVELFGRIENLFDADYQTVASYGTAGRGGYVGARARF